MTDVIPVKRWDATSLGEYEPADRVPMRLLQIPRGYIEGLKMEWISGTSLRVTSGAAYIPSLDRVLELPASVTKAGLSLSAGTWYHVYLFDNAGTANIEVVTTAPDTPFNGTARTKTGDDSRRYVGSVLTSAASFLMRFVQSGGSIGWREAPQYAPLRILAAGTSVAPANVSTSGCSPVTVASLSLRIISTVPRATGHIAYVNSSIDGSVVSSNNYVISVEQGMEFYLGMPVFNQSMQYLITPAPPSGGLYIDVLGYAYER